MEQMILAGMNVARLNFSHGDFSGHHAVIRSLRAAEQATGRGIAIMADLPGPKIRIGVLKREPIELLAGKTFVLTARDIVGDETRVSTTLKHLPQRVQPGDPIFLNDGLIQLEVCSVAGEDVHCRVLVGGELRSRKGLNLPDTDLSISAFTQHDHNCLKFALENGVDAVSQSFVERADDIRAVRSAAASSHIPSSSLGRAPRALNSIEEIIAADGVGDLRGLGWNCPLNKWRSYKSGLCGSRTCGPSQ
jgi:pyruvate kinase